MTQIIDLLRKHVKYPVTDNISFTHYEQEDHSIRFSNNNVNRENTKKSINYLITKVGFKNRIGSFITNTINEDSVKYSVEKALETAKLIPEDPEYMPPVLKAEAEKIKKVKIEFSELHDEEKYDVLGKAFKDLRAANLNSAGTISSYKNTVSFFNNNGLNLKHEEYNWHLNVTAMTENSSFKKTFSGHDKQSFDQASFMNHLIKMTNLSRNPVAHTPGKKTVVLSPVATCELLSYMFFYNFNAKAIDEKRNGLALRLNKQIANDKIHIFSKPDYKKASSIPFSATDGMPFTEFDMIKNGKFVTAWSDRYTARKKGITPTGEIPSNIIFKGTNKTIEDLIHNVEDGLYVNSFWYIRLVDLMDGIFTGMTRDGLFAIKKGKITESVKNMRFNQNVFDMLMNTVDIGEEQIFPPDMPFVLAFPSTTVKDFNFVSGTEF